jgi:hypothetical protein
MLIFKLGILLFLQLQQGELFYASVQSQQLDVSTVWSREALVKSWRAGYKLADILIAEATAEQIAECADACVKSCSLSGEAWRTDLEETLPMVDLTEPARLGRNFRLTGWKYLSDTGTVGSSPGRSEALNTCTDALPSKGITAWE